MVKSNRIYSSFWGKKDKWRWLLPDLDMCLSGTECLEITGTSVDILEPSNRIRFWKVCFCCEELKWEPESRITIININFGLKSNKQLFFQFLGLVSPFKLFSYYLSGFFFNLRTFMKVIQTCTFYCWVAEVMIITDSDVYWNSATACFLLSSQSSLSWFLSL